MKHILTALFSLCALTLPAQAHAFRVSPMSYELRPSGAKAMETIRIENTAANVLNAEITVDKRVVHEDGTETVTPAEDDFLIFPPQVVVEPTKTQAVRVKYIGDPAITQSVGYLVTVKQLPVKEEAREESGVQFVFEFGTSVNVVPEGASAKITVLDVKGEPGTAVIRAENTGNAYTRLTLGKWHFTNASGATYDLSGEPLREALQQGLIQPQSKRTIRLPLPASFSTAGLKAEFTQ